MTNIPKSGSSLWLLPSKEILELAWLLKKPEFFDEKVIVDVWAGIWDFLEYISTISRPNSLIAVDVIYEDEKSFLEAVERTKAQAKTVMEEYKWRIQQILYRTGEKRFWENIFSDMTRKILCDLKKNPDVVQLLQDYFRVKDRKRLIKNTQYKWSAGKVQYHTQIQDFHGKADIIFVNMTFNLQESPKQFLGTIAQKLAENGQLYITDFNYRWIIPTFLRALRESWMKNFVVWGDSIRWSFVSIRLTKQQIYEVVQTLWKQRDFVRY